MKQHDNFSIVNGYSGVLLFVLFLILMFCNKCGYSQGNLLVTPKRIVFEGGKQSQEINLVNIGQDTAVYAIGFVQYRMNEDGTVTEIFVPDSGQFFADKLIRFYPRNVEIPPKESQVVRTQIKRIPDLESGEYRSHMYFRSVPTEIPLGDDSTNPDSTNISVRIKTLFGISIPLIVRVGNNLSSSVNLSNISLKMLNDTTPILSISINRVGEISTYGNLIVEYISEKVRNVEVGFARGVAVYTPNLKRNFQLVLRNPEDVNYHNGKLIVKYQSENENKVETLDQTELILN